MTTPAWKPGPIPGFRQRDEPHRSCVIADAWVDRLSSGFDLDALHATVCRPRDRIGAADGRGPTAVLAIPGADARLHLRAIRHGGWLGGFRGGALFGPGRALDELRVTASLWERGAPVPQSVLMISQRSGPFWNASVGTIYEPDTVNGAAFLGADPEPECVLRAAAAAGAAIRSFHDLGGSHRDLHIGNLIVRRAPEIEVLLVDLDRAQHGDPPNASRRMAQLMRLQRSLIKRRLTQVVGAAGVAAFMAAYTRGEPQIRAALHSHLPRERFRIALHSVLYRSGR